MDWKEILFVIILAGGFLVPTALYKQWWLFSVFGIFFIVFGLVEWWAVAKTGMTVSQHFWSFAQVHNKSAWGIVIGMFVSWIALLWHFASRIK